jgi:hypothetical protein
VKGKERRRRKRKKITNKRTGKSDRNPSKKSAEKTERITI